MRSEDEHRERAREVEEEQTGGIERGVPRRRRALRGPQHRHGDTIDRDLEEGDEQQKMDGGPAPCLASRRQPEKRSVICSFDQGALPCASPKTGPRAAATRESLSEALAICSARTCRDGR